MKIQKNKEVENMKRIKRIATIMLSCIMVLGVVACEPKQENTAPEILGVTDQTVQAGEEFDALAGVSANDAEDGDLLNKVMLEATPELAFNNGKVTPENAGDYEITYSVTDEDGETTEAYATLTVTKSTEEAVVYKTFDFSAEQEVNHHGWEVRIGESAQATGEFKKGAIVFDIQNPGEGDGDVQLAKSSVEIEAADYRIKVWAKSTAKTYAHLLIRDEEASEWKTFGDAFNLEINQDIAPLEVNFSSEGTGKAEILLNLGKITPNPDNAEDTTPEDFTVTIDKIELYKVTGEETQTPIYSNDFTDGNADLLGISAGDGAEATTVLEGEEAVIAIDSFAGTDGGVWSIKADLLLPEISIEKDKKYFYSFTVTAENAQAGEILVESATQADANRANFDGLSVEAGEELTINNIFIAEQSVEDPVIRLQVGAAAPDVTTNRIVIDNLVFGTVEGDLETEKQIFNFMPYGKGSAAETNPEFPIDTYNGTDEDNEKGVGTIWNEDGKLYYRIDQGGLVDWHNKLIFGYSENPIKLDADSYFQIDITAKADKNISGGFFLNPLGSWDPRIAETLDITTEEQVFSFTTKDVLVTAMDFEMLFQFGSEDTASLGEVTIEIADITIHKIAVK